MKLGKAMALFLDIENEEYSDEEKATAIYHVMNMITHMSINKDAMIKAIKWLWHRHYEWVIPEDEFKEGITK